MTMMARVVLAILLAIALAAACGSDEEVGGGGSAAAGATDASGGSAGAAGDSGAPSDAGGSGGGCDLDASAFPDGCTQRDVGAAPAPLDIIFVVDQSASMDQEIAQVRSNINLSFASIIAASGIDYRVIMLAAKDEPNSVCVDPPLGGASCGENNPPLFYQVDQRNLSYESLQNFMTTFGSWQGYLRPGALRIIVEVTDDESVVTDATFDTWLLTGGGAGYFGTALDRRYVFHSIVGVRDVAQPTAPLVTQKCNTAVGPGIQYQRLSITSGGLRTPVCVSDYSAVFRAIAALVVNAGVCELALPAGANPGAVGVRYTPGGTGTPLDLPRVASEADCGTADGFYFDAACPPTRVLLCPETCRTVRSDSNAVLTLRLGCV